jgi:uncharacterized surface protein with fasciclin (FAS1) repeats
LDELVNSPNLEQILKTHAFGSEVFKQNLDAGKKNINVQSLSDAQLRIRRVSNSPSAYTVNHIPISTYDINVSNGVIHIIDGILLP